MKITKEYEKLTTKEFFEQARLTPEYQNVKKSFEEVQKDIDDDIAIGYTLASGKLFVDMEIFQAYAEKLIKEPIFHFAMSNSFANKDLWKRLRIAYEGKRLEQLPKKINF